MNEYKVTGIVFLIISGLIYTFERGVSLLSTSLIKASFFSGGMTGEVPEVEAIGFFSNLFVPLFLILGFGIVIYGLIKN